MRSTKEDSILDEGRSQKRNLALLCSEVDQKNKNECVFVQMVPGKRRASVIQSKLQHTACAQWQAAESLGIILMHRYRWIGDRTLGN